MAFASLSIGGLIIFVCSRTHFTTSLVLILIGCAYFPFIGHLINRISVYQRYHRQSDKIIDNTVIFTNESISLSNVNSDSRLNWNQLGFIVKTPKGLLFLFAPHTVWFWLPSRLFQGNNYREDIIELAAEHKIPIRRMA